MGAGFAEFFLGRNRSSGQAVPHPGDRVHADLGAGPKTKALHASGRLEPWGQTGAGGQTHTRVVSVRWRRGQSSLFSPTQTRKKCRTDPDAPRLAVTKVRQFRLC